MASLPDVKEAFIKRLEASATVQAQTTRIAGAMRKAWTDAPGKAIVLRLNGTPGIERWREVGLQPSRLDIDFYGRSPDEANDLWLNVHPVICPDQSASGKHSFIQDDCRVHWVELEAGPFELIDELTRLPITMASYVVLWSPVS